MRVSALLIIAATEGAIADFRFQEMTQVSDRLERNKANAMAFYHLMFNQCKLHSESGRASSPFLV